MGNLRVAILSSEAIPFAKTGGLGDVAGALPKALRESAGVDALLVLPLYEATDRRLLQNRIIDNLEVESPAGFRRQAAVWYSDVAGAPTFLIDAPEYFARPSIYGYEDDHRRFAFFNSATLSLLRRLGEPPRVLHGNDWICGFATVELQRGREFDSFYRQTRTLFSIHNLAYQGTFGAAELAGLGYGGREQELFMMNGSASALKAGLLSSDALSTVSRRYAEEIQTSEQGYGLDWILRARHDRLVGITNGIDTSVWNPATDPHLAANYSADDLTGKQFCKLDLLRRFGLPEDVSRPIVATISRLVA